MADVLNNALWLVKRSHLTISTNPIVLFQHKLTTLHQNLFKILDTDISHEPILDADFK